MATVSPYVLGVDISKTAIEKARTRHPNVQFEVADLLAQSVYESFNPDCIIMAEISWYVLEKLASFKELLVNKLGGKCSFIHLLMTYPEDEQRYGREYFTNIAEIRTYWDCVDFHQWGKFGCPDYRGGYRTFCYGTIK